MGVYCYYVNFTKRERFPIDALGGGIKERCIGNTLAAKAFHWMLVGEPGLGPAPEKFGRWSGDAVAIIRDEHITDWWQFKDDFKDIEADVILMFADRSFEEMCAACDDREELYAQLCHLILTGQAPQLEARMLRKFGKGYLQRYTDYCNCNPSYRPKDLAL